MNLTLKLLLLFVTFCIFIIWSVESVELVDATADEDAADEEQNLIDLDEYPLMTLLEKLVASRQRDTRSWRSNPKFRHYKAQSAGWKRGPMSDDEAHLVDQRRWNSGSRYNGYACQGNRCSAGWKRTPGVAAYEDLS
ncbi:hypothetical protein HOLleu_15860 [Holothuria leucospilota]|uniref:Uncharacterized protein n=1 Tax=Holothuria leucospilota TaxID=206669 RepID=A0A9Q1HAP9_HOLLE|nr:hypothetical protein HOLleu_15860 [Holothuria leucospilota]